MSRTPPRGTNSRPNWDDDRDRTYSRGNPNETVGGTPYRGGAMAPGPPPGATVHRGMPQRGDPNRSMTPSRPSPGATYVGPMAPNGTSRTPAISLRTSVVRPSVAPREHLLSGNVRRLWLSEIASIAGDVILGTGAVIWYLQIAHQFIPVALLLVALALPRAFVGFFAGSLVSIRDPRRLLTLMGVLRVALALLFVVMHYHTVQEVVLLLAFGLSLASNMRGALRRAAVAHGVPVRARGLLASGDQLAAGILSVAGPALATVLYVLNGERIFTIAAGAAACYLVALIGETQADPLPDKILYQRPANNEPKVANAWEGDEDAEADAAVVAAEAQAQVWELAAPPNAGAALGDISNGLGIVGTSSHAQAAFWGLTGLACVGGMLALAEPFYLIQQLHLEPFKLGLFFVATGLGAAVASAIVVELRAGGRFFLLVGCLASGIALLALPRMTDLPHALAVIAILGAANVFAIRGGQMVTLQHFLPVQQRAVSAALLAITGLAALVGTAGGILALRSGSKSLYTLNVNGTLVLGGLALLIGVLACAAQLLLPNRMPAIEEASEEDEAPEDEWGREYDESAEYSRYGPAVEDYDESGRYSAYSAQYPVYRDEYEAPRRRRAARDEEEDEPPRRGRSSRR
ncbi:MAG: MFS transporter [Ktedonobacterales bacterium]|nr:MFS transporter [Ktedonobacterales bacterium]